MKKKWNLEPQTLEEMERTRRALEWLGLQVYAQLDGTFHIPSSVSLSSQGLTELPDFSRCIVKGGFYCYNNKLTSLKGAPLSCVEFDCSSNLLPTLEGAPQEVEGRFSCNVNRLTTLKGAPREVGGFIDCTNNPLVSLEGAPQSFEVLKSDLGTFETPQDLAKVNAATTQKAIKPVRRFVLK